MKLVSKIRTRAKNMIKILKPITIAYIFILEKEKRGKEGGGGEGEKERRERILDKIIRYTFLYVSFEIGKFKVN